MQHKRVMSELEDFRAERETLLQNNHELLTQLKVVRGEKEELDVELVSLRGRLKDVEHSAG